MAREERTEKATPKHRQRARERGQVARSPDLGGSLVLGAGLFALSAMGPKILEATSASFHEILSQVARPESATSYAGLYELTHTVLATLALAVLPVAGACALAGTLAGVAQVGFRPSPRALAPDFRRINPAAGLRNLLGPNAIFETVKAIVKLAVVGAVATLALLPGLTELAAHVGVSPGTLGSLAGHGALALAQRAAGAYLVIGLIDYLWRRRRFEGLLKMTKQQVKDEARQYGVSAEVRSAQRRRRMAAARARMMAAVPSADAVVANPTHYAVALRYDGSRPAPEVVAKGRDLIAAQIRRVAEEHDVPVIVEPPLARSLYASCEIGQLVPRELYAAVAQVLAYVYRVAGRRRAAA